MKAYKFCFLNKKTLNISYIEQTAEIPYNSLHTAIARKQAFFRYEKELVQALDKLLPSWRFQ